VAEGARRIAAALGHGIVLYIRREHYVVPDVLAQLLEEGTVSFVKYAVERPVAANDDYLDALLGAVPLHLIASGMGETPVADHIGRRKLATFTSGAVCIAPRTVANLLRLLRAGRLDEAARTAAPFLEFERLRSRLGGIPMLHDAVAMAGIAPTGPILPMLANLDASARAAIAPSVQALVSAETAMMPA
jgi:dihydrodipicolinate synthase/N-acetylneuraminate lyase